MKARKVMAILTAVCMSVSMAGVVSAAEENSGADPATIEKAAEDSSVKIGVLMKTMSDAYSNKLGTAIQDYVEGHMKKCTDFYDYCIWDKAFYGAAPFHNQLTTIDSLDDCGSIASTLLEVMKDHVIPEGRKVGDMVADYMRNKQQRLPDGTFYRNHSYLPIMNETI